MKKVLISGLVLFLFVFVSVVDVMAETKGTPKLSQTQELFSLQGEPLQAETKGTPKLSQTEGTVIAVIKLDEIINKSVAMQKANKEIENKKNQIEKDLKGKEKKLMDEKNDLEGQFKVLDQAVAQEKALKWQEKLVKFQDEVRQNEQMLMNANREAIDQVLNNVKKIIAEIKKEKKYNFDIVIPATSTLYHSNELDISGDVMVRLDKQYKEVKVGFSNK